MQLSDGGEQAISADGRYVVFAASSLRLPGGTINIDVTQVYRRDLRSGATELVSRATGPEGAPADRFTGSPSISADGTRVAFQSFAALEPDHVDTTKAAVYVRDLAAATTTLVSRADGVGGALPDMSAGLPHISAGGGHVAFATTAANLGAPGGVDHAYVRHIAAGSHASSSTARPARPARSATTTSAASRSRATAVWSRSRRAPTTSTRPIRRRTCSVTSTCATPSRRRRRSSRGAAAAVGPGRTAAPTNRLISADGRVIAFRATDEALAPEAGTWGADDQIVARDLATAQNTLVSRAGSGAPADSDASDPSVSGDGAVIAFSSAADEPGRRGGRRVAARRVRAQHGDRRAERAAGVRPGRDEPQNRAQSASLSADGQCLAFQAIGPQRLHGGWGRHPHRVRIRRLRRLPEARGPAAGAAAAAGRGPKPAIDDASLLRQRFRVGKRRRRGRGEARDGVPLRPQRAGDVTIADRPRRAGPAHRAGKSVKPRKA